MDNICSNHPRPHMGHRFEYTPNPSDPFDSKRVVVESCGISMDDVIEAFESYLKASGFNLDGSRIELVGNESITHNAE